MKKIQTLALAIFILTLCSNAVYGQQERKIWTVAIDSLYSFISRYIYNPNQSYPIDATVGPDTSGYIVEDRPFFLYFERKLLENQDGMVRVITTQMFKREKTKNKFYRSKMKQNRLLIDSTLFKFCYKSIDSTEKVNLNSRENCVLHQPDSLPVKLFSLSEVMFSKNQNRAIVWGYVKSKSIRVDTEIWAMSLSKKNSTWKIEELIMEPAR